MKKLMIIVVMLVLASMASYEAVARELTAKEKAAIMEAVKHELKDPESARFKWVEADITWGMEMPSSPESHYCGLVNAKNSYGGYVGDKVFYIEATFQKGKIKQVKASLEDAYLCSAVLYTDFSSAK